MKLSLPIILTLLFLTLKLCGVIAWSWWWVFSPLWLVVVAWAVVLAAMLVREIIKK